MAAEARRETRQGVEGDEEGDGQDKTRQDSQLLFSRLPTKLAPCNATVTTMNLSYNQIGNEGDFR